MEQQEEKNSAEAKAKNVLRPEEEAHASVTESEATGQGDVVEAIGEEGPVYKGALVRLVAFLIDSILVIILNLIIYAALGIQLSSDPAAENGSGSSLATWVSLGILFVYFVGFWTIWRGITPGKLIVGAKIVKTNGEPIGLGRAILHFIGYFVYLLIIGLVVVGLKEHPFLRLLAAVFIILFAFLIISLNRRKRGLHDLIAGTLVVRRR